MPIRSLPVTAQRPQKKPPTCSQDRPGVLLNRSRSLRAIKLILLMYGPVLRPATPPPHGMVQVGVQGQGRGMPLLPHH